MFNFNLQFFAHKKGVGSTKNGRDSESKRLGAKRADGDVFRHCFWRYVRHIPAGRQKGREEGPLRLRPVSVRGHRDRDAVWRARFGMVLRVFVKFRPSKNCILALLRV